MKKLHLTITTATEPIFDGEVLSVTIPGAAGEMTIYPDHAPLVSLVNAGTAILRLPDGEDIEHRVKDAGTMEISNNTATLLL